MTSVYPPTKQGRVAKTPVTWAALLVAALSPFTPALAQQVAATPVPPPIEEETTILSPFVVSAESDQGYQATNTLAGTRIRTDLADVGSSISVLTKEFLQDVGGKNNESVLVYTTNTEVGGPRGNFSGGVTRNSRYEEQNLFGNPNGNTRVRGLTAADNTRNYFLTDIPWDGYTVSRVDLLRGPNAILFGLGSPAGVINATTNAAEFRNRGRVEFEYDKFGSTRTVLDYNRELLDDELALRFTLLKNDQRFQQDPAYSNDRRAYGAFSFRPALLNKGDSRLEFSGNFEHGKIRSNRPRQVTPGDLVSPFWQPLAQGGGDRKTFDILNQARRDADETYFDNVLTYAGGGTINQLVNSNGSVTWMQDAMTAFGQLRPDGSVIDRGNDGANGAWPRSNAIYRSGYTGVQIWAGQAGLPFSGVGAYTNRTLSDPSIFDFYNQLLDGPNKQEWTNWNVFNLNLSQTFFSDTIGYDVSYFKQKLDRGQWGVLGWDSTIRLDVNEVNVDTTANRDVGRPYVAIDTRDYANGVTYSNREAYRAQVFAEYDYSKKHRGRWAKLLGNQRITGVASTERQDQDSRSFMLSNLDPAGYKLFSPPGLLTGGDDVINLGYRYYLGGDLRSRTSAVGAALPNMASPFFSGTGGSINVRRFDSTWTAGAGVNPGDPWTNPYDPTSAYTQSNNPANYRGWVNTPLTMISALGNQTVNGMSARDYLTVSANLGEIDVRSRVGVWQGYFWDRAIVGIYGYREDKARSFTYITSYRNGNARADTGMADLDRTTYNFANPKGNVEQLVTRSKNWSVAMHVNRLLGQHDFLPFNLSFYYNRGENFQPAAGRINAFAEPLAPPRGSTEEKSMMLATKDNRFSVRLTDYRTSVINATSTDGQLQNTWALEQTLGFTANLVRDFLAGRANYADYTDAGGDAAKLRNVIIPAWIKMEADLKTQYPGFVNAWTTTSASTWGTTGTGTINVAAPAGFVATEDSLSHGYELEFVANPTKQWRIAVNGSKTEAVRTNVPGSLRPIADFVDNAMQNTDAGLAPVWWSGNVQGGRAVGPYPFFFRSDWLRVNALNGQSAGEVRKYRANLVTNYTFAHGRIKGAGVGGAYRWEDKSVIGYAPIQNTDGSYGVNLKAPFYAPGEKTVDLWVSYERMVTKDIKWRIQLNVYNAFGKNSLVPLSASVDESKILSVVDPVTGRIPPTATVPMRASSYFIKQGLSWQLSNTFEF